MFPPWPGWGCAKSDAAARRPRGRVQHGGEPAAGRLDARSASADSSHWARGGGAPGCWRRALARCARGTARRHMTPAVDLASNRSRSGRGSRRRRPHRAAASAMSGRGPWRTTGQGDHRGASRSDVTQARADAGRRCRRRRGRRSAARGGAFAAAGTASAGDSAAGAGVGADAARCRDRRSGGRHRHGRPHGRAGAARGGPLRGRPAARGSGRGPGRGRARPASRPPRAPPRPSPRPARPSSISIASARVVARRRWSRARSRRCACRGPAPPRGARSCGCAS